MSDLHQIYIKEFQHLRKQNGTRKILEMCYYFYNFYVLLLLEEEESASIDGAEQQVLSQHMRLCRRFDYC